MSDPGTSYRSRDEIQEVRQTRDPISSLREIILSNELISSDDLKALENEIKNQIDDATKKAKSDSEISVNELTYDIYANPECISNIRNIIPGSELPHKRFGSAVNL